MLHNDKLDCMGKKNLPIVILLIIVTLGAYSVSLRNGFVWDDEIIIVNNPETRQLSSLSELLFSPDLVKPYYRPLNRASYLLDYQLFGMHPAGFHAMNIVIHLLNVLLVFTLGRRIFPSQYPAFFAAMIFALHPVNTEAVNFISGRNNLLSLFFMLSSFLLFIRGKEHNGWRWIFLSALLLFLGLLCKETTLMVIVPIFFYSFFPFEPGDERGGKTNALMLGPFLAAIIAYLLMRAHALGGVVGAESPSQGLMDWVSLNYYVIPNYLYLMIFPRDLTIFHSIPSGGPYTTPWLAVAWIMIVAALWMLIRHKSKMVLFGLLWFGANYLPIANIIPIPSNPMAERYIYIPAVGLWLIAGEWIWKSCRRIPAQRWQGVPAFILLGTLGVLTVNRNLKWHDELSLFRSAIHVDPTSVSGHYNLGCAFRAQGDLTSAKREWESAINIAPHYPEALIQLGTLAAQQGALEKAKEYYQTALRSDPSQAMAHYNLAKIFEREKRPELAIEQYESFLQNVTVEYTHYIDDVQRRIEQLRDNIPSKGSDR